MADFTDTCALVKAGHFARMPRHYMARVRPMDFLVFWVLGGTGFVETEGRTYTGATGHLFTLRPRRPHRYGSDAQTPWDILWFHFTGAAAAGWVRTIRQFGGVRVDLGLDPALRERWEELVIIQNAGGVGAELRNHTALAAVVGQILQRLHLRLIEPQRVQPLDGAVWQRYIHDHYREPLTLAALARQAHRSPTHFARIFKRQFGVSPMYHVIETRMAAASALLTESNLPLKQISKAVGYDDPYYFSRLFKRRTGMSPTHYRKRRPESAPAAR